MTKHSAKRTRVTDFERGRIHQRRLDCPNSTPAAIAKKIGRSRGAVQEFLGLRRCVVEEVAARDEISPRDALITKLADEVTTINDRSFPTFASTRHIAMEARRLGHKCSRMTVWRVLKLAGFNPRVRPIVPINKPHVLAKRLAFARQWARRSLKEHKRLVFSDEHWLDTNDNTGRTQWVRGDGKPLVREQLNPLNVPSVMIWAAIGVGWRSPLVFAYRRKPQNAADYDGPKGLNSERYVRTCLSKVANVLATKKRIFMQDGARPHIAKGTMAYLSRKGIEVMPDWPPYSPDLNPIEQLWPLLDRLIAERAPRTQQELETAATAAWAAIPQQTIDNYIASFRGKAQRCVAAEGGCF